jgi:hypothetical protein
MHLAGRLNTSMSSAGTDLIHQSGLSILESLGLMVK